MPRAKFLGLRVAFKPVHWLEIALSRTAQWGGKGRPENLSTLTDLLLGQDNRGDNAITIENEPGNQLGGVEFKVSHSVPWGTMGGFIQAIGEDEAGGVPSRYVYTAGFGGTIAGRSGQLRWFVEYADTAAGGLFGDPRFNFAFEHGIYKSDYRFKGRNLAAAIDSDSRMTTLGLQWYTASGQSWRLKWSETELNRDGSRDNGFAGEGSVAELSYHWQGKSLALDAGYRWHDDNITIRGLPDAVSTPFVTLSRYW